MDYPEHERTYSGFLALFKWGTVAVVILLILMAFFLL
nr:aa3-type cytochrome c oxidase subunit IV [Mangrovicella endophytica]